MNLPQNSILQPKSYQEPLTMVTRDATASKPPPAASLLRYCTRTVSWSKNGIICYALATENGPNLNITFLENIDGKNWQLAPAQGVTLRPQDSRVVYPIVWVQWSNISTDLAVFDELGNFYILLAGVGLLKNQKQQKMVQNSFKSNGNSSGNGLDNGLGSLGPSLTSNSKPSTGDVTNGAESTKSDEPEAPLYELTSYNHTEMIYRDIQPSGPNQMSQGACVAFEWLPVDKPQIVNKPAQWLHESGSYVYGINQFKPELLAHPIQTKQACVAVRRSGIVNLYYQGEHKVEYHKLTVDLDSNPSELSLHLTHASIGFSADKKIVIVAYDAALNQILSYYLTLDWGFLINLAQRQRKYPHYHTPKEEQTPPSLVASLVHRMAPSAFVNAGVELNNMDKKENDSVADFARTGSNNPGFEGVPLETSRLVLIDLLSPYHEQTQHLDVLITYEHSTSTRQPNVFFSTLRFRFEDLATKLPLCFASIAGLGDPQTGQLFTLTLQDKFVVPGRFHAISLALSKTFVLFVLKSGDIIPVSRSTWKAIPRGKIEDDDVSTIKQEDLVTPKPLKPNPSMTMSSLLDCGFSLPKLAHSNKQFSFAVSPNMTCIVYLPTGGDANLSISMLEKTSRVKEFELTYMGLAHTHAHACYSNSCSDDLMALVKASYDRIESSNLRQVFLEKLNTEAHSAINFHLTSFGKESVDKLLSNPPLQKLLSLQLTLGDLSDNKKPRDVSWVVLNLRFTSFVIMFTLSSIYRQMKKSMDDSMEDSIHRAECIYSLVGNVKWLIDFIVYLNQELAQLSLSKLDSQNSRVTMENCLALPIILCKIPRLFLMYALSSIGKTHEILKKLHKELSESNKLYTPMKEALDRFFIACTSLPLKITTFEAFLRDCEVRISELVEKLADRSLLHRLEQDLFCRGKIPQEYAQVAATILDRHSQSIGRESNLLQMFFYDTKWISVGSADEQLKPPLLSKHLTNFVSHETQNGVGRSSANGNVMDIDSLEIPKSGTGTIIRQPYTKNEAVDILRKIFISCSSPVFSGGPSQMGRGYISAEKIRKCVRCRSVSLVADPLMFETLQVIALWTIVFQRSCICGSAWVNCIYT